VGGRPDAPDQQERADQKEDQPPQSPRFPECLDLLGPGCYLVLKIVQDCFWLPSQRQTCREMRGTAPDRIGSMLQGIQAVQDGAVIWLLGDFRDQLRVSHVARGVDNNHGSRE
jgi:hypothetical protein